MAWQDEMIPILRELIADTADIPTYSDEMMERSILVAAQLLSKDLQYSKEYTIDISSLSLDPDPTESEKDHTFINLIPLKAAINIIRGEIRTYSLTSITVTDEGASINMSGIVKGLEGLLKELQKTFDEAKRNNTYFYNVNVEAILGSISVYNLSTIRGNII